MNIRVEFQTYNRRELSVIIGGLSQCINSSQSPDLGVKQSWPPLNGHTNRRVNNRAHVKQDMSS